MADMHDRTLFCCADVPRYAGAKEDTTSLLLLQVLPVYSDRADDMHLTVQHSLLLQLPGFDDLVADPLSQRDEELPSR